jgi:predicted AAA+ superfamily ATPase
MTHTMCPSDLIARHASSEVLEALQEARIVALLGPRQAGKSTLAKSLVSDGFPATFNSLDDDAAREAAHADPRGYLEAIGRPAIIDEIQRVPELMLALKSRVDADSSPGQYLLTGSANLPSVPAVRDALPGRIDFVDLWPLSQGEIEGRRETFIDDAFGGHVSLIRNAPIGRGAYAERIAAGGFPDARTRSARGRERYFDGYVRTMFGPDVRDVSAADPRITEAMLRQVASRAAGLVNLSSLGRAVGVSEKTAGAHLDVLERLLLVRRHAPWLSNQSRRLVKLNRAYVTDTGLACHLCGFDAQRLVADDAAIGGMLETFVVLELVRQATWSRTRVRVLHYRDRDQREVDVVLERPDGALVGIEVKARATVRQADTRSLVTLRDRLGERFVLGVVLHTGADTLPFGDRLWAAPVSALWQ